MIFLLETRGIYHYIKPSIFYNTEDDFTYKKKIRFSSSIPKYISFNRKMFSEKRGRVLKK